MVYEKIDYNKLVNEAMHLIVHKALKLVNEKGLPGNHHFFISFATKYSGVKISQALISKYPKEMTIVLQYQFQELFVDAKGFGVTLSFNGIKEKIYIPFAALITFADPSVQFGLQFKEMDYDYSDDIDASTENPVAPISSKSNLTSTKKSSKAKKTLENNVVSLDKFRKK